MCAYLHVTTNCFMEGPEATIQKRLLFERVDQWLYKYVKIDSLAYSLGFPFLFLQLTSLLIQPLSVLNLHQINETGLSHTYLSRVAAKMR